MSEAIAYPIVESQNVQAVAARLADIPAHTSIVHKGGDGDIVVLADDRGDYRRFFVVRSAGASRARISDAISIGVGSGRSLAVNPVIVAEAGVLRVLCGSAQDKAGNDEDANHELHMDFDRLARAALAMRASDIHITSFDGRGEVKFRIDGLLEAYADWDHEYTVAFCRSAYNTLVETGSTKSGFTPNIGQDGVIERTLPEGLVRFRYASTPLSPNGFDIALRLIPLGVNQGERSLASLGYSPDQCDDLDRMFAHSSGLIFFVGTTGSGKSTSMSVALEGVARAKPGKKIRTVEQPVEYRIKGAYQTSVGRDDFISAISQMMRLDPDYMMVGETRDEETAEAVLHGARSGHLCVSTLHADSAPLAYDRLQGLGVARHDLASVGLVAGIVYQKLVPKLCQSCKQPAAEYAEEHPDDPILDRVRHVNDGTLEGVYFARQGGCSVCKKRGAVGRTVCAEVLRPQAKMLSAISSGDSRGLWTAWRSMIDKNDRSIMRGRTAFEHAIYKMRRGVVSPVAVEQEFKYLDEPVFLGGGDA